MKPEFWRDKKVFITGHTGFKGSWMSLWLQRCGADVIGYSLGVPSRPALYEVAEVGKGMRSIEGDVRDLVCLKDEMARHQPHIVIHMAAQSLVRASYADPGETFTTNVVGTVNVLEAVRYTDSVKVVLIVTSDKCYENKEWVWGYRENEPMGGHDPYSSSKGCAELVTAAYRSSFFSTHCPGNRHVAVASARAGNVIGGGDWAPDRLVPDVVRAFADGREVEIRYPNAIRPWQNVLEPVSGYLMLAESLWDRGAEFAEAWNFGPNDDDAKPVAWLVDEIARLWGGGTRWGMNLIPQPQEANYLKLDSTKAKTRLGWRPRLPLAVALEWCTEWYKAYYQGQDMRKHTIEQIAVYEAMSNV